MSLVVIAVLAVIWVVALTPMILRKLSERRLSTSVDSFHRQLGSLRRAYPRLAASAAQPELTLTMARPPDFGGSQPSTEEYQEIDEPYRARPRAYGRPSSRERRRRVLLTLGVMVLGFLLLGAIPGLRVLWDASLLAFGVTAAYVALLIHFHRRASERAIKVVEMQDHRRDVRVGALEAAYATHADEQRNVSKSMGQTDRELLAYAYEDFDESVAGGR